MPNGNFNFPGINWRGEISSKKDEIFVDSIRDAFFYQMVVNPTRNRHGQKLQI